MEIRYCLICGKEIAQRNYGQARYSQLKYCSRECVVKAHTANGHPWRVDRRKKCMSTR
jgi:hypothetical protein